MNKPLLIIVSGRPGSGKTTLAGIIATEIRCPLISRDVIKEGYLNTMQKEHGKTGQDEMKSVYECFFSAINLFIEYRITCVAESAFQHKLWYPKYNELSERAAIVIVKCHTDPEIANRRFLDRKAQDPLREYFHGDNSILGINDEYEFVHPQFPAPSLEVDTTEGYRPSLDEITAFIRASAK